MSFNFFEEDVIFAQRFLKSAGFYSSKIDGVWGPLTDKAEESFFALTELLANKIGKFDARSEKYILTLLPKAQEKAREFLKALKNHPKTVKIISGTRTYQEQDGLYAKGRTAPGNKVTNAQGGQSNHNFGLAWDIGVFENGNYLTDSKSYTDVGKVVSWQNIEWGGNWTSFKDYPHYQYLLGKNVSQVRALFEQGNLIL